MIKTMRIVIDLIGGEESDVQRVVSEIKRLLHEEASGAFAGIGLETYEHDGPDDAGP